MRFMRLVVAAIGRLKDGPERELAERYRKRAEQTGRRIGFRDTEVVEIRESRAQEVVKRMTEESIALASIIPERAITHHPRRARRKPRQRHAGEPARQTGATMAAQPRSSSSAAMAGLAPALRDKATVKLAFGAATWPHQLVRVMLLEQIYRAVSILSGHPYHRA